MQTELADKVVLITGASGGIGSAMARQFAGEGARVALHYNRGRAGALALQKEIGCAARAFQADLAKEKETVRLFKLAVEEFGRIDILIANAGSWEIPDTPLDAMSLKHWQRTMEGVLTTMFLSLREFLRIVKRQKRGNAVLIASTAAVFGEAGHADYATGKAGIAYGLTRTLKNEITRIAPHTKTYCGGRVNCICPGWTIVPRSAELLSNRQKLQRVTATMALPQVARPEDIANAAVFLSSDKLARHITGQTLVIAGGMEGRQLWASGEVDTTIV